MLTNYILPKKFKSFNKSTIQGVSSFATLHMNKTSLFNYGMYVIGGEKNFCN